MGYRRILFDLAYYLVVGNSDRDQYPTSILCLGTLLLGSSALLLLFSQV